MVLKNNLCKCEIMIMIPDQNANLKRPIVADHSKIMTYEPKTGPTEGQREGKPKLDIEVIIFNDKSGNGNELGKIKGSLGNGNLEGLTNLYLLF